MLSPLAAVVILAILWQFIVAYLAVVITRSMLENEWHRAARRSRRWDYPVYHSEGRPTVPTRPRARPTRPLGPSRVWEEY